MVRLGAGPSDMREMETDDVFFSRLQLLIIMSTAYLNDYPLGEQRNRAVLNNVRQITNDSVDWNGRVKNFRTQIRIKGAMDLDHVFFQRVKLLAVMVKSFVEGNPMGHFRRKALEDNLYKICEAIAYQNSFQGMNFLKVA